MFGKKFISAFRPASHRRGPVTVLAIVQLKTQLKELLRAAVVLRDSGRYRVVFYLDTESDSLAREMRLECENDDFATVIPAGRDGDKLNWSAFALVRRMHSRLYVALIGALSHRTTAGALARRLLGVREELADTHDEVGLFRACLQNEVRQARKLASLFSSLRPALVLVGEDGLGGNSAVTAVAKEYGTRTLVVPYEFSKLKQILQSIGSRYPFRQDSLFDRILVNRYPKWLRRTDDGTAILRMPSVIALARELQGQSVNNPWTVHGGHADRIAVESDEMRRHYLGEGLPARKLHDTGALAADEMYRTMIANPAAKSAFETGRRLRSGRVAILCALPPDYVNDPSVRCEFTSFREMADFWIETVLSVPNVDAVFQVHPAMAGEHVDYVRSRVHVSSENIATLIPRCDLLVTSVSSIIRLSIACRKPVVNYDVYGFDYSDYVDAPGVSNVASRAEFRSVVARLASDDTAYAAATAAQQASGQQWGIVDGQSGRRFLELVDSMAMR